MVTLSKPQLVLRALQGLTGLAAMVFTSLGYIHYTTGQLSSAAAIYSYIANYTAIIASVYYIVALHLLKLSRRSPKMHFQRVTDLLLAVALVIAGLVHTNSEAYSKCDAYNTMFKTYHGSGLFRCGNMTMGVVLTFVAAGLFLVTIATSFMATPKAASAMANEEEPSAARGYTEVATPVVKDTEPEIQVHPRLRAVRLGSRAVQFVSALVVLVCIVSGYRHYFTGQYLSPTATYAILMSYTCMLYSMWHLVVVQKLQLARRPKLHVERSVDGILALMMLVAGISVATSTHVQDCNEINESFMRSHGADLFRCGSMSSGTIFCFIAMATYVLSLGVSYFMPGAVEENIRDAELTVMSTHSEMVGERA